MGRAILAIAVSAVVVLGGCGSSGTDQFANTTVKQGPGGTMVVTGPGPDISIPAGPPPKKLVVEDLKVGHGAKAKRGDTLSVRDVAVRYVNGEAFESNWEKGKSPFTFDLNTEDVSPGWVRGLQGMRVGGRRKLIVPPPLISRFGVAPGTGPEATLVYVIELLKLGDLHKRGEPALLAPSGTPPAKLVVKDIRPGSGPRAKRGDELTVEYVGIHYDGSPFTNSWERKKPFRFQLGAPNILINPGWEKGLKGMRVGGRRELVVPPALLQRGGAPPGSSPADTLVYVIDLIELSG